MCYVFMSRDISLFYSEKKSLQCLQMIAIYIDWVLKCTNYNEIMNSLEIMIIYIEWWCM